MQDPSSKKLQKKISERGSDDPSSPFPLVKPGQTTVQSVHRAKISGHTRFVTVTWVRNLLAQGFSISIQGSNCDEMTVKLKPWSFWRKHGSKKFTFDDERCINVYWDLRHAKFSGAAEPQSSYYLALVDHDQIILLLGDLRKEAYKKIGVGTEIDAALVSKKEHVYGKRSFTTRSKFQEKGKYHEILIECGSRGMGDKLEPQMVVKIDGNVMIHVKHLQWKFRGNETISLVNTRERVEVYWDVHDWLFSPGMKHALFIFKPLPSVHSSLIGGPNFDAKGFNGGDGSSSSSSSSSSSTSFCLFLYAWKIE